MRARSWVIPPNWKFRWKRVRLEWTWEEVAWVLTHGGKERLERAISYGRDVWDLGQKPTPPLTAWTVERWLEDHKEQQGKTRRIDL